MYTAKTILSTVLVLALAACDAGAASAGGKARADLYACEGCEAVSERAADGLDWRAVVASPDEPGERLVATGVVYAPDGKTPQEGVVIYLHQTNAAGLYAGGTDESEWSRRHGRLRGWIRTDAEGRYRFETIKPAPYPDMTMRAHLHFTVKEPGRPPYYIDDIVFAGEYMVDAAYEKAQELRGGSGIVELEAGADGVLVARRNIVLERHPE